MRAAGLDAGGANLTLGIQHFMLKVGDAWADEYSGSHKLGAQAAPITKKQQEEESELGRRGKGPCGVEDGLAAFIRNPDRSIDPAVVGRDDRCPLGQWLHGDAKKRLAVLPEYRT